MFRAPITGKAQSVSASDFNARVKELLVGRSDVEKGDKVHKQSAFSKNPADRKR
jgi:hypothetical protein